MLNLVRGLFAITAILESAVLYIDSGGPEIMITESLNMEQIRLGIILTALICYSGLMVVQNES